MYVGGFCFLSDSIQDPEVSATNLRFKICMLAVSSSCRYHCTVSIHFNHDICMLTVRSFTICSISPRNQNTVLNLKLNFSCRFLSHHTDKMRCVVPCIFNPLCAEFVS